jgi:hypothetical protein
MDKETEIELNRYLTGWIRANRYIFKSIAKYSLLFVVQGSTIKVNLDEFSLEFQRKFIRFNFEGYCKQLLEALKPKLNKFVKRMNWKTSQCFLYLGSTRISIIKQLCILSFLAIVCSPIHN